MTFVQKICTFNVDEIDYRGQFHQYFVRIFLSDYITDYIFVTKIKMFRAHSLKVDSTSRAGVDPTKLFFFANKEFFHFSLVSLHFCYIQKQIIDWKMT